MNQKLLSAPQLVTDSVSLRTIEEGENDSGTETLHDTDSEQEDQHSKQEDLIKECTGLNVSVCLYFIQIQFFIKYNTGFSIVDGVK